MFQAGRYYFTKSEDYTGASFSVAMTIRISITGILSIRELLDIIIHEEWHQAVDGIEGMDEEQAHRALKVCNPDFW